jgi:hypothetical protein
VNVFQKLFRFVQPFCLVLMAVLLLAGAGQPRAHAQTLAFTPSLSHLYAGDPTGNNAISPANFSGTPDGLTMKNPYGVAIDAAGNIYLGESGIVRVVAKGTSVPALPGVTTTPDQVYTLAGAGANGTGSACAGGTSSGDGCLATLASISPKGLAVDKNGNVYFADGNTIHVVYADGAVAGLTDANNNNGLKQGYLYAVVNSGNSGTLSSPNLAVNVSANPTTVAVDSYGNIFFGTNGSVSYTGIPVVVYAGGTVPGLPATPTVGWAYSLGTTDTSIGVSCTDATNPCGDNETFSSTTLFKGAYSVYVDAHDNVYFVDTNEKRLRVLYRGSGIVAGIENPQNGFIYTIAGNGTASSARPADGSVAASTPLNFDTNIYDSASYSVATDAAGDVYINLDGYYKGIVYKIDPSGKLYLVYGGSKADALGNRSFCALPIDGNPAGNNDGYGDGCPSTTTYLPNSEQLATDAQGNLYVANNSSGDYTASKGQIVHESLAGQGNVVFSGTAGYTLSNQTFTVSNVGASTLTLTGITASGPFAVAPSGGSTDCTTSTSLAAGASCQIGVSITATAPGSYTGSIAVASNSTNASSGSNIVTLKALMAKGTSAAVLTVTPPPPTQINSGENFTFTATITPQLSDSNPLTGTVTFYNGTTALGTANVSNNVATLPTASLAAAGSYQLTAQYSGNSNYNGTTTSALTVTVASASAPVADVALSSSASSIAFGAPVTLTATVSSSITGTVTFQDGMNALAAPVQLVGGVATLTTTSLPPGRNTVVAHYNGDSSYGANYSAPIFIAVSGNTSPLLAITPGMIQKLAGSYKSTGTAGDGGAANLAMLSNKDIVVDASGNVYMRTTGRIRVAAAKTGTIAGVSVTAGDIYTVAGGGTKTYSDGLSATSVTIVPQAIALDGFGSIYFIDQASRKVSVIRRVDGATGIVTTVAGTAGKTGYSGDGGLATAALIFPSALYVDAPGNIYEVEGNSNTPNNLVRRVDALTGIITTVAGNTTNVGVAVGVNTGAYANFCYTAPCGDGGLATSAFLTYPGAVTLDNAGNLYIADTDDQVIRKVDAKTGIISTAAGSYGTAYEYGGFNGYPTVPPNGDGGPATSAVLKFPGIGAGTLLLDGAGNLYFTDNASSRFSNGNTVREVNAKTGIIETIVGNASSATPTCVDSTSCGDGGLATAAQIGTIAGLGLDAGGNMYLSDSTLYVVREIPVNASAVNFGSQNLGVTNTQAFTLSNTGGSDLNISSLAVNTSSTPVPAPADFFEATSTSGTDCSTVTTLAPGADCALTVEWFPSVTTPATENAVVTITSNSANATSGANTITLSGSGIGSAGSTPQNINFPALSNANCTAGPTTLNCPYGTQFALAATTDATDTSLAISYRVSGPATLNGTTLTATGVGTVNVTAYQFGNAQYASAAPVSQNFTVTQAPLTVAATSQSITLGNKAPTPTYTITGFENGDTLDGVVTGQAAATISSSTGAVIAVGSMPSIGSYTITLMQNTLSAGANYKLNFVNGTLSVTGSGSQTIQFGSLSNVTYGITPIALSATSVDTETGAATGLPITYTASGPATVTGNLLSITGAGAVAVTANQTGGEGYQAATAATQSFTVSPATLTVTAGNESVAQGATMPSLTSDYSFSGWVNGDTSSSVSGTPIITTTATDTSTIGTYSINIGKGSLSSANYTFSLVNGTLSVVNGQPQTISFPALPSVTYGVVPLALTAKASSGLGVTYTVTSGPANMAGSVLSITGAGTVTVTATQSGNSTYAPATAVSQSFAVNPAPLTVVVANVTRVNDTANPAFTYLLTGFVYSDTQSSATSGLPTLTTTALPGSPVGTYPITYTGGLSAANYSVTSLPGTLTITTGGPTADFTVSSSPQQFNMLAGQTEQATISLSPTNYYAGQVTLSCTNLPANVSCTFSPATITADGTATVQTTTLTINTSSSTVVASANHTPTIDVAAFYLPGTLCGLLLLFGRRRLAKHLNKLQLVVLAILLTGASGLVACGGSTKSSSSGNATPGTYSISVKATGADGASHTLPISLLIH